MFDPAKLLKNGGIKFLVKSLDNFPTNIGVKRKACDVRLSSSLLSLCPHSSMLQWAVAMVIGPPGRWRQFARQAIRKGESGRSLRGD